MAAKFALLLLLAPLAEAVIELETTCSFENFGEGQIISEVCAPDCFGSAAIDGCFTAFAIDNLRDMTKPQNLGILEEVPADRTNVLTVFDSACRNATGASSNETCTGGDPDLFQVTFGNTLIIQETFRDSFDPTDLEDGFFDDPDDSARGGCMWFNFNGGSTPFGFGGVASIAAVTFQDIDETGLPRIRCSKWDDTVVTVADVSESAQGNGRAGIVNTMAECMDTRILEICLPGSGAVDGFKLTVDTDAACPPINDDLEDDDDWMGCRHYETCANIRAETDPYRRAHKCRRWGNRWYGRASDKCAASCCTPPKEVCIQEEPDCGEDGEFSGNLCYWHEKDCDWIASSMFRKYFCWNMKDSEGRYAHEVCEATCCES